MKSFRASFLLHRKLKNYVSQFCCASVTDKNDRREDGELHAFLSLGIKFTLFIRPCHTERAYASRTPSEAQERRGGCCDGISGEKRAVTCECCTFPHEIPLG